LRRKDELILALIREIEMQAEFFELDKKQKSIYFGGGTPSLLNENELNAILQKTFDIFSVVENPEITLEANPEDLSREKLIAWKKLGINRLSIGIQSLQNSVLKLLNRGHKRESALAAITLAQDCGFENITVDVIFGVPALASKTLEDDLYTLIRTDVPHISAYSLTIEPKTALHRYTAQGKIALPDEETVTEQFLLVCKILTENNFRHYEISNYGKENFYSQHNSNYWKKGTYLGIGPSAHSYDGEKRYANVANNERYVREIMSCNLPHTIENLTLHDHINEYLLTALRTEDGIDLSFLAEKYHFDIMKVFPKQADKNISENLIFIENNKIKLTLSGKLFADAVASDFFLLKEDKIF
jgi:oxygen-independent coproporphyrinogen-3 oxidase